MVLGTDHCLENLDARGGCRLRQLAEKDRAQAAALVRIRDSERKLAFFGPIVAYMAWPTIWPSFPATATIPY